jgi:WD40 repeat protein
MTPVQDFVSAVMDVDYSPTGREFVAGGYDRSVRIFSHLGGHSREVYHTKRMQRVFAVRFSGDGGYVFSGSDDMNVRIWKVGCPRSGLSWLAAMRAGLWHPIVGCPVSGLFWLTPGRRGPWHLVVGCPALGLSITISGQVRVGALLWVLAPI